MEQNQANEFDPTVEANKKIASKAARLLESIGADYRLEYAGDAYGNREFYEAGKKRCKILSKYRHLIEPLEAGQQTVIDVLEGDEVSRVAASLSAHAGRIWGHGAHTYTSFPERGQIVITRFTAQPGLLDG